MIQPENSDPLLDIRAEAGVMRITLKRAEKKNALTQSMYRGLATALRVANADPEIAAVTLEGGPGVFTAGNDLTDFMAGGADQGAAAALDLLTALGEVDVVLIAAVDGPAIGVGTTLLLHCDAALASANARFRTPFIDLALCPEGASSLLMPGRLGRHATQRLLMLGEELSAEEARSCGLVDRLVDDPSGAAAALAARYAAKPREALRASKRLIREAQAEHVNAAFSREAAVFAERLRSAEAQAMIAAFFQRK